LIGLEVFEQVADVLVFDQGLIRKRHDNGVDL
jgi:hypothetical protein